MGVLQVCLSGRLCLASGIVLFDEMLLVSGQYLPAVLQGRRVMAPVPATLAVLVWSKRAIFRHLGGSL
ncbi:hypothetical protein E2C01_038647 [Portunus trituberculatus]|uniref:Uncharacterized protein n=1 Tax=Portunus trituberculatus TaxID=210409 RepID=A0A5B7FHD4_PORTR|nr:hypothetical protein [Portunus trituberculatus]